MKPRNHRIYWLASFGIAAALCIYFGHQYSRLRATEHHLPLVAILIASDQNWLITRVVEYELSRRIQNGDFNGADVLSDTLIVGQTRDDLRPIAIRRAEWLVENLVDVNSDMTMGQPPLFAAIFANDPFAVEELLRLGADPKMKVVVGSPDDARLDAVQCAKIAQALFPDRDMTAIFDLLGIDSLTE